MKFSRLFIGRHVEPTRPVYRVDERLMARIDEARRRLGEVHVKPVRGLNRRVESAASRRS